VRRRSVWVAAALVVVVAGFLAARAWFPGPTESGYSVVGEWGGEGDGPGQFDGPIGIAIAGDEVFVSDSGNSRIEVFDLEGSFLREIPVSKARPMHIDVANGRLYVPDYLGDRIVIMDLEGRVLGELGGSGAGPGLFDAPSAAAADADGRVWVADFYNQRVQLLDKGGTPVRQLGVTGGKGIRGGRFNYPTDVALLSDGRVVVADAYNDRIQVFSIEGEPLARWGGPFGANLGGRWSSWFRVAVGVGIGRGDRIFVADMDNNRVQKFTADGIFLVALEAGFDRPTDVAEADDGSLYVADFGHDRVVRMVQNPD